MLSYFRLFRYGETVREYRRDVVFHQYGIHTVLRVYAVDNAAGPCLVIGIFGPIIIHRSGGDIDAEPEVGTIPRVSEGVNAAAARRRFVVYSGASGRSGAGRITGICHRRIPRQFHKRICTQRHVRGYINFFQTAFRKSVISQCKRLIAREQNFL